MKNGKVVVIGGQHAGERFAFSEAPILIGSAEECAIRLTDRGVQPNHASIDRTPEGGWLLASIGSAAELEVRGQAVSEIMLEPGLVFRLGGVALRDPIVSGGPFVMSTPAELADAGQRYRRGEMGQLNPSFQR